MRRISPTRTNRVTTERKSSDRCETKIRLGSRLHHGASFGKRRIVIREQMAAGRYGWQYVASCTIRFRNSTEKSNVISSLESFRPINHGCTSNLILVLRVRISARVQIGYDVSAVVPTYNLYTNDLRRRICRPSQCAVQRFSRGFSNHDSSEYNSCAFGMNNVFARRTIFTSFFFPVIFFFFSLFFFSVFDL